MSNRRSFINSYSKTINSFLRRMNKSEPCPDLVAHLNGPVPPPHPRRLPSAVYTVSTTTITTSNGYSNNNNIYNEILSKVLTKDDLRLINGPVPVTSNGPFWWSEIGSAGHPEATYLPDVSEDKEGMAVMDLTFPTVVTTIVSEASTITTTSEKRENRPTEEQSMERQETDIAQRLDQTTAVSRSGSISKDEYAQREIAKPRPRQGLRPQSYIPDWNRHVPRHHLYVRSLQDLEQVNERLDVWLKSQRRSRIRLGVGTARDS